MRAIRHALTERYYTWEDAVKVADTDPEIDLQGAPGRVYNPDAYEDDSYGEQWDAAEAEASAPSQDAKAEGLEKGKKLEKEVFN